VRTSEFAAVPPPRRSPNAAERLSAQASTAEDGFPQCPQSASDGLPFKPSTIREYEEALRLLAIPKLAAVPVDTITRGDVQRFVDVVAGEQTATHAAVARR